MNYKRLLIFFLIIIFFLIFSYIYPSITSYEIQEEYELEEAFVIRVIDGDTIETDLGDIRLLGINTPEKSDYLYQEAKDYLRKIENKTIYVLRDNMDKDKYDRLLRYVFYENNMLNLELLENGLAVRYMDNDLKYQEKIIRAEEYAIINELGLYEISKSSCSNCIKLEKLDYENEFFILENQCSYDCSLEGWYVQDSGRNKVQLTSINAYQQETFTSNKHIWNNDGDRFFLRDQQGLLVFSYSY